MADKLVPSRFYNRIFYGVLLLSLALLLLRWSAAADQNKEIVAAQSLYFQAVQELNRSNPQEAEKLLSVCIEKWPDNPMVIWAYAVALAANQKYDAADEYMNKAEDLKAGLLIRPGFLLQHADVLKEKGEMKAAVFYLQQVKENTQDPQYLEMADQYLQSLSKPE